MTNLNLRTAFLCIVVCLSFNHAINAQPGELNTIFYTDIAAIDVEIQQDGKLVCATTPIWGFQNNSIARLNPNGSLDNSYQNYLNSWAGNILDLDINQDNYAIAVGDFTLYYGTQQRNNIVRLLPNGNIDLTFPEIPAFGFLNQVLIQSDSKVLFSGSFGSFDGTSCNQICRVQWDGELDSTFVENIGTGFEGNGVPNKFFECEDGKILVWASTESFNGNLYPGGLIKLNNDGTIDNTFSVGSGPAGNSPVQEIQSCDMTDDGKILLCGTFTSFNGVPANGVVRLLPDGCLDNTFSGWTDTAFEIKADPFSDKIYIIGGFDEYQGVPIKNFARLHENGDLDLSFDPGGSINCCSENLTGVVGPETIKAIAFTSNGQILLGGGIFMYDNIVPSGVGLISVWTGSDVVSETLVSLVGPATEQESWNADLELISDNGITYYSSNPIYLSGSNNPLDETTKVKFRANYNWSINWGGDTFPSGQAFQNGPNIHITTSGFYNISLNIQSGEYSFDFISPPPSISLIGTAAQGWNNDVMMETTNGKIYTLPSINLTNGEVKFRQNENWEVNWGNSLFPQSCGTQDGPNIPVVEGEYSVYFNRVSGNYNFSSLTTNIDDIEGNEMSIFPNPSSNVVYIKNSNSLKKLYKIIDLNGKTIQQGTLIDQSIDLSSISSGVFILQIQTQDSQIEIFKLVKE